MQAPDPVAFTILGTKIMWYGVLVASGFVTAIIISYLRAPKHGLKSDDVLDFALWMIPLSIVGARAYYVIFEWDMYKDNPIGVFALRNGGLAIHGGLIAGVIVALLVCRYKKISFLELADLVFPSVALAQSIGRWGNFFNSEAHGGPTNLPWAIMVDGELVHPTFLYESLWCLFLFFLLLHIDKKRKFRGQIVLLYGMLYSVERCLVEQLRTDSLMIGPFKQAQVLSISVFVLCLIAYIILYNKEKKKGELTPPQDQETTSV